MLDSAVYENIDDLQNRIAEKYVTIKEYVSWGEQLELGVV